MKVPEVNKEYYYYDDGKITLSRQGKVLITDIVEFNKIDEHTLKLWQDELIQCDWLYSPNTDYFVKGKLIDEGEELIFVKTLKDEWFSFNSYLWDGVLDVDGSLTKELNRNKN